MATPPLVLAQLQQLRDAYSEADAAMLVKVQKRLKAGITQAGWTEAKRAQVSRMYAELSAQVAAANAMTASELQSIMQYNYQTGSKAAKGLFQAQKIDLAKGVSVSGIVPGVNTRGIEALYAATVGQISNANLLVLRKTMDQYRAIVSQASTYGLIGVETRQQVAQRMLNKMADSNITGFVDKAGRSWAMDSYAEMASRTAMTHSYINGRLDQFSAYGIDLVQIDSSSETCSLCAPWEGRILSVSGHDPQYPPLSDAHGLFHPNCTHNVAPYLESVGPLYDTNLMDRGFDPEAYSERMQQRSNERDIRRWKRRQAVAMDPAEANRASAMLAQAKARQKAFLEATGRKRLSDRESVGSSAGRAIATVPKAPKPPTGLLFDPDTGGYVAKADQLAANQVLKLSSKGPFAPEYVPVSLEAGIRSVLSGSSQARGTFLPRSQLEMDEMMQTQVSSLTRTYDRTGTPLVEDARLQAIRDYTGTQYEEVNAFLRVRADVGATTLPTMHVERTIDGLQQAMAPLPQDSVFYRGTGRSTFPDGVPAVGDVLQENAFMSTTVDRQTAVLWGREYVLEIEVPRGTSVIWAEPWTRSTGEMEVILQWGQQMQVISLRQEGVGYAERTVVRVRITGNAYY